MYNIIQIEDNHRQQNMSTIANATKPATKIDCAKECPYGVPVIPVPDQWLEVMVTGGFKVWHIIFIIIAFVVTLVVVYCCFHRCRIPRTKQEIEADLMRSNLANKFRDYLHELPNEPTTFVEALKKVQEIEEKLEQDDAMLARDLGARKRMGWLKLKGKDKATAATVVADNAAADNNPAPASDNPKPKEQEKSGVDKLQVSASGLANVVQQQQQQHHQAQLDSTAAKLEAEQRPELVDKKPSALKAEGKIRLIKTSGEQSVDAKVAKKVVAHTSKAPKGDKSTSETGDKNNATTKVKTKKSQLIDGAANGQDDIPMINNNDPVSVVESNLVQHTEPKSTVAKSGAKTRKKRDKPNLSRTKKAHVKSMEHNQLELPQQATHHHHHNHNRNHHNKISQQNDLGQPTATSSQAAPKTTRPKSKSRTKETKKEDSTVIQIPEQ